MFDLELQSKYSPSFFSPDRLDEAKVELEWDRALFIWIDYSLAEFLCPPQNYEIYTTQISKFPLAVFLSWKGMIKK